MVNVAVNIIEYLLMAIVSGIIAIAVAFLQKKVKSDEIDSAIARVGEAAVLVVASLEQSLVEEWKISGGGKLSKDQIEKLRGIAESTIVDVMDAPAIELLNAVGIDIKALIEGSVEKAVLMMKQ